MSLISPTTTYAVAHLQPEIGRGKQIHAGTVHTSGVELVGRMESERTECHTVEFTLVIRMRRDTTDV